MIPVFLEEVEEGHLRRESIPHPSYPFEEQRKALAPASRSLLRTLAEEGSVINSSGDDASDRSRLRPSSLEALRMIAPPTISIHVQDGGK